MYKIILLTFGLATSLFAKNPGNLGIFEGASDVGQVAKNGSVGFDAVKGEYHVTGSGANIWGKHDDFYFLWRKVSGDLTLTATVRFEGPAGAAHRKVALMIRNGLEPGSPHVNAAVHGDGLTAIQFRELADDITRSVKFPVNGPTHLRLERRGNTYTLFAGKEGQALVEAGTIQVNLVGPVYAGLAVCPHDPQAEMTAVFSDVTLEVPKPAESGKVTKKQN